MPGFNQVVLMGKLVRDPELKYVNSFPLCTMRLYVPRFYKNKDGEQKNDSLFIDVIIWRRMAEICSQALAKNSEIMVAGRLQMNEWTGRDGKKRVTYQVQSERIQFLRRKETEPSDDAPDRPAQLSEPMEEEAPAAGTEAA